MPFQKTILTPQHPMYAVLAPKIRKGMRASSTRTLVPSPAF